MRTLWQLIVTVTLLALLLFGGGSWYFSEVLIASPVKSITAEEIAQARERLDPAGVPNAELVSIPVRDDITLAGYLYNNPQQNVACGVVILHGYNSLAYDMASFIPMFWEPGCAVLAYDARGHGNSSEADHTYGYYERQDAADVVDWLAEEMGLAPEQIGLLGVSYGAATAVQLLSVRSDVAFVVADSAYQDYETIIAERAVVDYGEVIRPIANSAVALSGWRAYFDPSKVSAVDHIADNETPVLLIHALQDEFTPASHSEAIYANANPERTVLEITDWGAGHGRSRSANPEAYQALVYDFIASYAPAFGQP